MTEERELGLEAVRALINLTFSRLREYSKVCCQGGKGDCGPGDRWCLWEGRGELRESETVLGSCDINEINTK